MKDMKLPAWVGNIVAAWPPLRALVGVVASYAIPCVLRRATGDPAAKVTVATLARLYQHAAGANGQR